jgi:hypothetical protein
MSAAAKKIETAMDILAGKKSIHINGYMYGGKKLIYINGNTAGKKIVYVYISMEIWQKKM